MTLVVPWTVTAGDQPRIGDPLPMGLGRS